MTRSLENRIALVTGASRGVGRAFAVELAREGAHVVALARTQGALEELDDEIRALGGASTLAPCDVTDFPALDRLGAALAERWGRLDILIGNAGVLGPVTPLPQIDPEAWDATLAVNLTANWRLIRSLDPLLRKSDAGRVVFISSGAGNRARMRAYRGPYGVTKAALDALARIYAAETENVSKVRVMTVNPGPLRTRMRATLMPGEDPMSLPTPEDFVRKAIKLCRPDWTETGAVYDFREDRVKRFRAPD